MIDTWLLSDGRDLQVLAVKRLFDLGLIKHWALSNENAYGLTMFCLACDRVCGARTPAARPAQPV